MDGTTRPGSEERTAAHVVAAAAEARRRYEGFAFVHRALREEERAYLRERSLAYRRTAAALRGMIREAVDQICGSCADVCCHLSLPGSDIYTATAVGCFDLRDHLLARGDDDLPAPDHGNAARNLCSFWDQGCRLPPDRRSLTCLAYFCEPLRRVLDVDAVERTVAELRAIVDDLSLERLLGR